MSRASVPWLATALALVAPAAPLAAQGVGNMATGPGIVHSCGSCHSTHPGNASAANLRLGASAVSAAYRLPGLRDASTACMRCHGTAAIRAEEARVADADILPILEGRYLGLDLSDDHPLGSARPRAMDRLSLRSLLEAEREAEPMSTAPLIDCSDCHDPHEKNVGSWNPANDSRCAACHDESRYSLAMHSALSCANCHQLHGGAQPALLSGRDSDYLCVTCHATAGKAGDYADPARIEGPPGHVVSTLQRCADCHPAHGPG